MSDPPDELSGATEEVSEPVEVWRDADDSPAWEKIANQAQSAAPGSAEPGASPELAPTRAPDAPTQIQPATEAGRSRRPASLRDQNVSDSSSVPRRKLPTPDFPSAAFVSGTRRGSLESDGDEQPPLAKFPKDEAPTDKISMDKPPLDKLPTDKLPLDQVRALTRQRPEVGLGLAFAGGLLIATILKRLGRR